MVTVRIPRGGTVVEQPLDTDERRIAARTELELLRCVRECLEQADLKTIGTRRDQFSDEQRAELRQIVDDAGRHDLQDFIAAVDQQFTDLHKELDMSVLRDEAAKIVNDAMDSGALIALPTEPGTETVNDPAAIEAALLAAEASLAAVAGAVDELSQLDDFVVSDSTNTSASTPDTKPDPVSADSTNVLADPGPMDLAPSPAEEASATISDDAGSSACTASAVDALIRATASVDAATASMSQDSFKPAAAANFTESTGAEETTASSVVATRGAVDATASFAGSGVAAIPGSFSASSSPATWGERQVQFADRAAQAVESVEAGIRRLADVLRHDVREQWNQAQAALREIIQGREKAEECCRQAQRTVDELQRLRQTVDVTAGAADLARREAELFREDARRAKERAEASALAAENAARQTSAEVVELQRRFRAGSGA